VDWNGRKVTPFWLASEAKQIRAQADAQSPTDAKDARALADRMDTTANAATKALNVNDLPDGWRQLPDSPRYGLLRGMVVRKEIHGDIVGSTSMVTDQNLAQAVLGDGGMLARGTALWKWSKVAANPPSQVRNFFSNGIALHLSGVAFHAVPARIVQAFKDIKADGPAYRVIKKYGATESTFSNQELRRIDTDYIDLVARQGGNRWQQLHAMGAKVMNWTGDLYQFTETLFKTAKVIDAMEKGASDEDAFLQAQDALFDYSNVSPSLRYLRNAPLGIPFVTWQSKMLPFLVDTALHHPLRLAPYLAIPYLLTAWLAASQDVEPDDVDALKLALPKWLRDRGNAWLLPFKDEKGRWQAMDFGYFLPWSFVTDVAKKAAAGKPGEALMTAGLFGSPVVDLATAIQTGKDSFTGKDIINQYDPPGVQVAGMMNYLWRMAMPTFITDIGVLGPDFAAMAQGKSPFAGKLAEALTDKVDRYGQQKTTISQALARLFGANLYPIDPELSRAENLRRMRSDIQQTEARIRILLKDPNLSQGEREGIVESYRGELQERAQELKDYAKASVVNPKLRTRPVLEAAGG
jgi:hypothetical protein